MAAACCWIRHQPARYDLRVLRLLWSRNEENPLYPSRARASRERLVEDPPGVTISEDDYVHVSAEVHAAFDKHSVRRG